MLRRAVFAFGAAMLVAGTAGAEELKLRIGIASDPASLDPHFRNLAADIAMLRLIYEPLTWIDKNQEAVPLLAKSWRQSGDTAWEFTLRPDAAFNDGSPVTARDVVFSLCRVRALGAGPESFAVYAAGIVGVAAPEAKEVTIRTAAPDPALPQSLAGIAIVSAKAAGVTGEIAYGAEGCTGIAAYPSRADFDSGRMAVGSGTHRLAKHVPGRELVLSRVADYWAGMKTRWGTLEFDVLPDPGARLAALMTGQVELVNELPADSLPRLKFDGSVAFGIAPSIAHLVQLQFNHRPASGGAKNPFADVRVRQAVASAIDRAALAAKLSQSVTFPAETLMPAEFDQTGNLMSDAYGRTASGSEGGPDAVGARHLLAEAGYPNGLTARLAAPERLRELATLVAAQLKAVGIAAELVAPGAAGDFDLAIGDWPGLTGELGVALKALLHSPDPKRGLGGDNWGGYGNPAFDGRLAAAASLTDPAARQRELRAVEAAALADAALVPLLFQRESWGERYGVAFDTRMTRRSIFAQHIVNCVPCHELNP